jgi:hypothetical protein
MKTSGRLLVGALASLVVLPVALAGTSLDAETRVGGLDLGNHHSVHSVRADRAVTLGTHQGYGLAYDDLASDFLLAARGAARAVDPNKLHHIFGDAAHGLDDVVKAAGSREAAFGAMEKAAQGAFDAGKFAEIRPGVFEGAANVGGVDVIVRGAVVDGVFRIGSAWR